MFCLTWLVCLPVGLDLLKLHVWRGQFLDQETVNYR